MKKKDLKELTRTIKRRENILIEITEKTINQTKELETLKLMFVFFITYLYSNVFVAEASSSTSASVTSLALFSGSVTPYIITVCVLAIMFLSLVFMLIYLMRMRKILNRKMDEIEEKERRPAFVRAVDRYLWC